MAAPARVILAVTHLYAKEQPLSVRSVVPSCEQSMLHASVHLNVLLGTHLFAAVLHCMYV